MSFIYNTFFYNPIFNILAFLVSVLPGGSLGLSVIILTVFVNLLLLPLTHKMKRSQKKIQDIQPDLEAIKEKHKDNKEEQARRTMELYRKHGINPFSGFLVPLLQIPIFIAIFRILRSDLNFTNAALYGFIHVSANPSTMFLGFDLTTPFLPLTLITAAIQFLQGSLMAPAVTGKNKNSGFASMMQQQFKFIMLGIVIFAGLSFPATLMLYWTTMSTFGIVHEAYVRYKARIQQANNGNGGETRQ